MIKVKKNPMRITFLMPQVEMSGGIRVVFEYARQFLRMGHEVTLVYPSLSRPAFGFSPQSIRSWKKFLYLQAKRFRHMGLEEVRFYEMGDHLRQVRDPRMESEIPDGDIVVATSWETANWVVELPEAKGDKWYLIQSYEAWGGAKAESVDATWKLPLKKVAISSWLKELGETRFNERMFGPVFNGVDGELFKPQEERQPFNGRVGMMYGAWEFKGTADGLAAFEIARGEVAGLTLVMFGKTTGRPQGIPSYVEYHGRPSQESLAELYRTFDIFLFPSKFEGWGLPPMEAMASGVPVVATQIDGLKDYVVPGETALLSEPGKPELLAKNLVTLATDGQLRECLSAAALEQVQNFTWERSAEQLLELFRSNRVKELV